MAPIAVVNWLKEHFPRPSVDQEWLDACCAWISEEKGHNATTNFDAYIKEVETQLLRSSLVDSLVEGTGFPPNILQLDKAQLSGKPILVELTSITEIAHSAFSLLNTRQAMIDRADLAGLTPDSVDLEDENHVPKYPRGMLKFILSDGSTKVPAIEYRSLPGLGLGVTPLGFKMMLRDVSVRRGIIFLEPRSTTLLGHYTEDLEQRKDIIFLRSLHNRLGLPEPQEQNNAVAEPARPTIAPVVPVPPPVRSPLRELSDPPEPPAPGFSRHDDEDQPRRRKIPNNQTVPNIPSSSTSSGSSLVQSPYFSSSSGTSGPSTTLQRDQRRSPTHIDFEAVTVDDDEPFILPSATKQSDAFSDTSSDYFGETMDADFLEQIDILEREALGSSAPVNAATWGRRSPEIIVVEDEEDDKENVPVHTRLVRRRIEPPLDIDYDDVIDISE